MTLERETGVITSYCTLAGAISVREINPDWVPGERQGELIATVNELLQRSDIKRLSLTNRENRVLSLRFGLEEGRSRTLEEVGREFGVTRERIRQIEAKALRKLRYPSNSRIIAGYTALSPLSLGRQVWGTVFVKDLPPMEGFESDLNLDEEAQSSLPLGQETVPLYLRELLRRECGEIPDHIKEQIQAEFERVSQEEKSKREQALKKKLLATGLLAGFDIEPDRLDGLAQIPLWEIRITYGSYLYEQLSQLRNPGIIGSLLEADRKTLLARIALLGVKHLRQLGQELERLLGGETGYPPGFLGVFFMMHSQYYNYRRYGIPELPRPIDLVEEETENILLPEVNLNREQLDNLSSLMLASMATPPNPPSIIYRSLWDAGIYTLGNLLACTRPELFSGVSRLSAKSVKQLGHDLGITLRFSGDPVAKIVNLLVTDYEHHRPTSLIFYREKYHTI